MSKFYNKFKHPLREMSQSSHNVCFPLEKSNKPNLYNFRCVPGSQQLKDKLLLNDYGGNFIVDQTTMVILMTNSHWSLGFSYCDKIHIT